MNAVDTNVFAYAVDVRDAAKHTKAVALLRSLVSTPSQTVMPWHVAGEFLNCLLRWQDAGFIAACIVAGVDTLYSEDLTDGATYDTVKVVNPFV